MILGVVIVASLLLVFIYRSKHSEGSLDNRLSKARLLVRGGDLKEAQDEYRKIIEDFKEDEDLVVVFDELAEICRAQNQLLKAKQVYIDIIRHYPGSDAISQIQEKLWDLNIEILFSGIITKYSTIYVVEPGDTLSKISKKFKTTVDLIMKSNDLRNTTIRPNDRLKVVTANFSIMIDKSQNILTLKVDDEVLKIYTVSTGKDNCTPTGEFKIDSKLKDPVWYKTGAIVPAESPENILGSRWIGLSVKGYGIHGTVDESTIGKNITDGCVRMRNKEVEELFTIVPEGTEVIIVD